METALVLCGNAISCWLCTGPQIIIQVERNSFFCRWTNWNTGKAGERSSKFWRVESYRPGWDFGYAGQGTAEVCTEAGKLKGSFKRFSPRRENIFWHIFAMKLVICCPIYNSQLSITSKLLRGRKANVIWIELYITVRCSHSGYDL